MRERTGSFSGSAKPTLLVYCWLAQSILKQLVSTGHHQGCKLTMTYCHYQTKCIRIMTHLNMKT